MKQPSEKAMQRSLELNRHNLEVQVHHVNAATLICDCIDCSAQILRVAHAIDAYAEERFADGLRAAANRCDVKAESAAHVGADAASVNYQDCADDIRALLPSEPEERGGEV